MARQTNIFRLPVPPTLMSKLEPDNATILNKHLQEMTVILNQALQSFQNRLNTIQQTGKNNVPNVQGFTVTGKQGLFYLSWKRIKNVDGYVIMQAADSQMKQLTNRYHISDGQQVSFQVAVGNVVVTSSFQIYAYQGPNYGSPSNIVTATTSAYGAGESAPPTPPIAPQPPLLAPVRSGPNLP